MKNLVDVLRHKYKVMHKGEEILVEEHALNLAPEINKSFHKNEIIHAMHESEEEIIKIIDSIEQTHDAKIKKSDIELLKLCLEPYENRTIEVKEGKVNYKEIKKILEKNGVKSAVANYKYSLFELTNEDLWKKHKPIPEERIVIYAFPRKRGAKALEEIAGILGRLVAPEEKRYENYALRAYKINDVHGLHARPSAELVQIASKYPDAEILVRTDSREVNGKSMMDLLMLEATANKPLTMLFKPSEKSEQFYREIESIPFEGANLFSKKS